MSFVNTVSIWGWPHLFKRLGKETLLLADQQFLKAYQNKHHKLKCHTASASDLVEMPSDVKNVLVFLRRGEMRLVRSLRKKLHGCQVFSVQYDLVPNCLRWPATLPSIVLDKPRDRDISLHSTKLKLLVSTACSDVEYLVQSLENRGVGTIADAFARPLFHLLDYVEDFQPARYASRLLELHAGGGVFSANLPVEVLLKLVEVTSLSTKRLQRFLRQNNVRILYFKRADKLVQSVLLELVLRKRFRSVWSVAAAKRDGLTRNAKVSVPKALAHMVAINADEHAIEHMLATVENVTHITLDQFIADPEPVLADVWRQMGFEEEMQPPLADLIAHEDCYARIDGLAGNIKQIQRELIDRTGLHLYNQQKSVS